MSLPEEGRCKECGAYFGAHYQYCTVMVMKDITKQILAEEDKPKVDKPVIDQDVLLWLETAEYLLSKVRKRLSGG